MVAAVMEEGQHELCCSLDPELKGVNRYDRVSVYRLSPGLRPDFPQGDTSVLAHETLLSTVFGHVAASCKQVDVWLKTAKILCYTKLYLPLTKAVFINVSLLSN